MELTKLDIAALRKADSICFDHNVRSGFDDDTRRGHFIRAIKRRAPSDSDPYATDITHRIEVTSYLHDYAADRELDRDGTMFPSYFTAFHMAHHVSPELETVFATLRPGDRLDMGWARGNSTRNLEEAGLHRDELRLTVRRGEKWKRTFLVAVSVCPDNTARMTQRRFERVATDSA